MPTTSRKTRAATENGCSVCKTHLARCRIDTIPRHGGIFRDHCHCAPHPARCQRDRHRYWHLFLGELNLLPSNFGHLMNADMEMRRGVESPERPAGLTERVPTVRRRGRQSKRRLGRRARINARRPALHGGGCPRGERWVLCRLVFRDESYSSQGWPCGSEPSSTSSGSNSTYVLLRAIFPTDCRCHRSI